MWLQIENVQTQAQNHTDQISACSILWSPPHYERLLTFPNYIPVHMLLSFTALSSPYIRGGETLHVGFRCASVLDTGSVEF